MSDLGVVNLPGGQPTLRMTGGAAVRLAAITPPGMQAGRRADDDRRIPLRLRPGDHLGRALAGLTPGGAVGLIRQNFDRKVFPHMAKSLAKRKSGTLVENIKTIVYAGLIAVVIRTVAYEPFNIPSGSMIPTLLVGDYLFVSKFSYGYSRFSLPFSPPLFSGRIFGRLPNRGDVAVFKYPRDNTTDYIKRIVGLPGDRIQVKQGQLYINGTLVPREPAGEYTADDDGIHMVLRRYLETLPNGVQHYILKATDEGDMNNTQEYLVPPDHVFAMGDNRDNSADSRFMNGVGFVPVENLVGRAEIIFFSVDARVPDSGNSGSGRSRSAGRGSCRAFIDPANRNHSRPRVRQARLAARGADAPLRAPRAGTRQPAAQKHGAGSNERLEFVGDRVLGLLMAEWLAERFPHEQEGALGRRLGHLVSQPVLADVADAIGLDDALAVSPGEAKAGIKKRATVLADALEAALGAVYLDGGLAPARAFVRRAWEAAMTAQADPPKDAKTALQEWAQTQGPNLPVYEQTDRSGPPHAALVHRAGDRRRPCRHRHRRHQARRRDRRRGGPAGKLNAMTARCGFAAILGAPNAGKSTLLNRLTGRQALHRHAQGADHALPCPRHPDARGRRRFCWWTRPASSNPAVGSTVRWSPPPGPARTTPTSRCCWSMPRPARPRRCAASPRSSGPPAAAAGSC